MATKITDDKILEINRAYLIEKTYAGVARKLGISPSTVKKYIIPNFVAPEDKKIIKFSGDLPQFSTYDFKNVEDWGSLTTLSAEERAEIEELWKELVI